MAFEDDVYEAVEEQRQVINLMDAFSITFDRPKGLYSVRPIDDETLMDPHAAVVHIRDAVRAAWPLDDSDGDHVA